jgi:hypothetical protein
VAGIRRTENLLQNIADAFITFPRMRPDEGTEPDPAGGGGCAGHVPSLAGHPAGRNPDLITGG